MRGAGLAGVLALSALLLSGCAPTKYVPVCSEHGGIKEVMGPDHVDDYFTRDVLCKDGVTQRPEQMEDPSGKNRLVVPSER